MTSRTIERRVAIPSTQALAQALRDSDLISDEVAEQFDDAERDTVQECIDWEHGPATWTIEIVCTAVCVDDEY